MEKAAAITLANRRQVEAGLSLPLQDVVITLMASFAAAFLLIRGWGMPGALASALVFAAIAVITPSLRALSRRFPRSRLFDAAATFWPIPMVGFAHANLSPIVDTAHPRLMDAYLGHSDVVLFGGHPSALLESHLPPLLVDGLLACYYSYFIWPTALAALLYWGGRRRELNHFLLALMLLFSANFLSYVLVPAIGPRFYYSGIFQQPLQGVVLAPYLESLMRLPGFTRDCFPSGHTAGTLLVLTFAHLYLRRLFWFMLPFGVGLIAATVAGRFHYGTDLIFAIPLVVLVVGAANFFAKARPAGVVVPRPALAWRDLLSA